MMRSIPVLAVMVAFGAGSAMAATCYVKGEKGCASGSIVKVDGIDQCKVGKESPELAFFKTKKDCAAGENASVASANGSSGKIAGDADNGIGGPKNKVPRPYPSNVCFFSVPEANGQTTCMQGLITPVDKIFPVMPTQISGSALCTAGGWQVSRYYWDADCKGKQFDSMKVCWVMKKDSSECEVARVGYIADAEEGKKSSVDVCNVAGETEMDFFFDNHCEHGNLAWKANKSGKIAGEKQADQNAIKPIVDDAISCADCDRNPPARKGKKTKKGPKARSADDAG